MSNPIVKIILSAVDNVSGPSKAAEGGVDGFTKKIGTAAKAVSAFIAGSALARFFQSAVAASVEFEKSQSRLEATAKLTGVALEDLQAISARGQKEFGLNANLANDFAIELAKLASKAGDVGKAGPAMQAFLDIGAARGLSASETLKAVQQAVLGIDEGTDKLFNKNPSALYAEYAAQIGTTAGKLTDQQKQQAILNAALTDGAKVQGEYQKYLDSMGGAIDRVKNGWESFKIAVGQAITSGGEMSQVTSGLAGVLGHLAGWVKDNEVGIGRFTAAAIDVGRAIVDVAKAIFEILRPGLQYLSGGGGALALLTLIVNELGVGFRGFAGAALWAYGQVEKATAAFIDKAGKVLRVFGIHLSDEYVATLKRSAEAAVEQGAKLLEQAKDQHEFAQQQFTKAAERGEDDRLRVARTGAESVAAAVAAAAQQAAQARAAAAAEAREREKKEAEEHAKFMKDIEAKQLEAYIAKQKKIAEEPRFWEQIRSSVATINQQHEWANEQLTAQRNTLATSVGHARELKAETEQEAAAQTAATKAAKERQEKLEKTVDAAAQIGRSFIDIGQATGLIDRDMGSVLNSVVNIGVSLTKIGVDPLGGMIGVISGLANVITGFGNSEAHKRYVETMNRNRDAVERLTREVGNLNLGATGRAFAGTRTAIEATQQAMASGQIGGRTHVERSNNALAFFRQQLLSQGVSVADARQLLEDLQFGDVLSSGTTFVGSLGAVQSGLAQTEFGRYGQDFESQLQALQDSFDVFGLGDEQKLSGYATLASRFSPALAAALGSGDPRGALQSLFSQLVTGGLAPGDFGQLSGTQFRDMIKLLLPLFGDSASVAAGGEGALTFGVSTDKGAKLPIAAGALGDVGALIAPELATSILPAGGGPSASLGAQYNEITFGDIHVEITSPLTGDPARDGERIGAAIRAALEDELPDITRSVLRRAGDELALQRGAQGLS